MKKVIARLIGWYYNLMVYISPKSIGRKGFYLFCTPARLVIKDHQRQFLDSAERSTFDSDGNLIQVYKWGSGPKKVLFLHGWESHSYRWKSYIEALPKDEFTVFTLDAPAHGLSGGRYLNLPIYSSVVEKFLLNTGAMNAIVSHSFGSFAAIYTLFRYPMPVNQLVVMGVPGEVSEFVNFYQSVLGFSDRTMKAIRGAFDETVYHQPEYYSASKFARGIHVPGLIIHDEQDVETPYRHAVEIRKAWKTSRLITTSGLGHNLRSTAVVKKVVDFLAASPAVQQTSDQKLELVSG